MWEWWGDWWSWDFARQHMLIIMFASAFFSATVLPGNSEAVFTVFAVPQLWLHPLFSPHLTALLLTATAGNALGSFTTYAIGRCFPKIDAKTDRTLWVLARLEKYGNAALLLSWMPVIGDVLCAAAGWLKLNWKTALLCITLGKFFRYLMLLLLNGWIFG